MSSHNQHNRSQQAALRKPGGSGDTMYEYLRQYGQEHILRFWEELDTHGRERLRKQIERIDWSALSDAIARYTLTDERDTMGADARPAPYWPLEPQGADLGQDYAEAAEQGRHMVSEGRVGAFTVAGGQGTRLGFDGPKGTFPISPLQGKTLFQLFAETILRAQEKYEVIIPWYIMTSPMNYEATCDFFAENQSFGLLSENLFFFPQGTMPAIDYDGKVLLEKKDAIAQSPNGHGGCLTALYQSGALDDMRRRGIDHITYWQVDNPLVKPFDPLFLGLHEKTGSDMSSRALMKRDPYEKLGNFCIIQGKTCIVEYSDLPREKAEQRDEQNMLRFRAGSPAIHLFRREFIERLTANGRPSLPFHRADKKVPHIDAEGKTVQPEVPNAVKLEMFVFDALPSARNPLILEVERQEQFAPLKNKTGPDSIDSCRALLMQRAARWLEQAGVSVPRKKDGTLDCQLELSARKYIDENDVWNNRQQMASPPRKGKVYYQ